GSLTTPPALLSKGFHRKRATAMALTTTGSSLGGALLVLVTDSLISRVGWRLTWVVLGLLVLVLVLPVAFVLLRDDPEEMGLRPDGDAPLSDGDQPQPVLPGPLEVAYWRDAFRSTPMWQLCGGYFVCGLSIALVSTHFVPFAIERGFSHHTAAFSYSLIALLNRAGVLPVGGLSDPSRP